jgi:hypothetical protein
MLPPLCVYSQCRMPGMLHRHQMLRPAGHVLHQWALSSVLLQYIYCGIYHNITPASTATVTSAS